MAKIDVAKMPSAMEYINNLYSQTSIVITLTKPEGHDEASVSVEGNVTDFDMINSAFLLQTMHQAYVKMAVECYVDMEYPIDEIPNMIDEVHQTMKDKIIELIKERMEDNG